MRQILIEPTENPKVLKFVADYNLIPGSLELDRNSDISEIPLAQELFNYPFVERIFITANFIAVAKQTFQSKAKLNYSDSFLQFAGLWLSSP